MTLVQSDYAKCDEVASFLANVPIPTDEEDTSVDGFSSDETANFYLLLVAICHQTQTLKGRVNDKPLRGWEYLSPKLERWCKEHREFLNPERWTQINGTDLLCIFHDDHHGDTLSDPNGRAELVRDLGTVMTNSGWTTFNEVHAVACGYIEDNSPSILQLLSGFQAYSDPVRKKAYFLLGLMANSGTWQFQDPQNLGPPVDYHEIRGHLRLNTVVVADDALRQKLLAGEFVTEEEDIAIRQATANAIKRISAHPGLPYPMTLHYLFWYLFRQICRRDAPYCRTVPEGNDVGLPKRYEHFLNVVGTTPRCPFAELCPSSDVEHRYIEHKFTTHWY